MAWGVLDMKRFVREQSERKSLLGMAGAFIFLVSLIPIPAYMGTGSHPCGTPLAGILLGRSGHPSDESRTGAAEARLQLRRIPP